MNDEKSTLQGRIARYARVGTAMGGVAARLAGERFLGMKIERDAHAAELRTALGGLKGPLMKVAQILSTIPDAIPQEYVQELAQLQSDAPAMGRPFVKRRMMTELGADWRQRFAEFDLDAVSAASLGQVHRATGLDGVPLACKLQYPDMQSAVEADLKQLKLVFGIYGRYDKAVRTDQIHGEIAARLREELDYELEARHMAMYGDMLGETAGVAVPKVVPGLSTKRLLTMTWVEGAKLLSFKDADAETRNAIAVHMFRAWYVPFYYYGVIHGDPHLGNYTVRPDLTVNLLDFGCVRVFPSRFVGGVIELYRALLANDDERARYAYDLWGFKDVSKELLDVLNIWARFIYAPILEDRTRSIEETNNGRYGQATAQKVHEELRRVGGVEIPREFVFMDRAAIGLGSVFLHLRSELNWFQQFHELIEGFEVEKLAQRQSALLARHDVPGPA